MVEHFLQILFVIWCLTALQSADGASVTWYEPLPVEVAVSAGQDPTPAKKTLFEGKTASLSWNFSLTSVNLFSVTIRFNNDRLALSGPGGSAARVDDAQKDKFNFTWISQRLTLVIFHVTAAYDESKGNFSCEAFAAEGTWTRKIQVKVVAPPRITFSSNNQADVEGSDLDLLCNATGIPTPKITWTRVLEDGTSSKVLFVGSPWITTNVRRNFTGQYRCTADNGIGSDVNHTVYVDVLYKPDNVTLERNTTGNNGCTDLWVNFTCHSSQANPPVYNYALIKKETDIKKETEFIFSKKGTWIEKISRGETIFYKCQAYQQVGNVTSTNISLSVKEPPAIEQIQDIKVEEGGNVIKECKETAGTPSPTIFWKNINAGKVWYRKLLNITDIRRNQGGEYSCFANNTCGNDSTTMFIDVQFGLENVTLEGNATENSGCVDIWVNFTCNSSVANPPAYDYLLLRNETEFSFSKNGTWIAQISRGETFVYQCRAYQKFNNVTSSNSITVTVNELPAVEHLKNKTLDEFSNLTVECNVTAGFPSPTKFWENGNTFEGNPLIFPNITRSQRGEYRCNANNTCGRVSATMFIDVQYHPDQVNLDIAPSGTVCRGSTVQLTCTADANPPVHTYVLFQNGTRNSTNEFGTWTKIMNSSGKFVFKCEAYSSKGNSTSKDTLLNVDDPPAVKQTSKVTVKEGENVTGECNLTAGTPPPYQFWQNVKTGQFVKTGKLLTITNITRHQTEYKCVANNTCGRASATMFIDVKCACLHQQHSFEKITCFTGV